MEAGDLKRALDVLKSAVKTDAEADEIQRRSRDAKAASVFSNIIARSNVPVHHFRKVGLDTGGGWGEVCDAVVSQVGSGFFMALVGIRGSGKTQIAVEAVRTCAETGWRCFFCTPTRFFLDLKATYGDRGKDGGLTEADVVERYARWPLLVVDEIGQRGETDWEDRVLFEMLNRRYNGDVDTLLLGNDGRAKLEENLGPSLVSRMRERGGVVACKWPSFRR